MYTYDGTIVNVVDGDTVDMAVDLGLDVSISVRLRLYGINAPEMHGPTAAKGVAARQHLLDLLGGISAHVVIKTVKDRREKYGRYLATIYTGDTIPGTSVNQKMVDDGFAVPYFRGLR